MATATAEQARGAEQIMRSADMKSITRHVERSTQEQTRIITRLDSLDAATRRQLDRTHVMRSPPS